MIEVSFCDVCGQQAPVDKYFLVCAQCEELAREAHDLAQTFADERFYSFQEKYGRD